MKIGEFLRKKQLSVGDNARYLLEAMGVGEEVLKRLESLIGESAKMSKSKGNVVDPQSAIEKYGADTIRLYILFAGPPEQDFEWTDEGIQGAHRFLSRLWNFVEERADSLRKAEDSMELLTAARGRAREVRREVHVALEGYLRDMEERYQFNTAIAKIMKLYNVLSDFEPSSPSDYAVLKEGVKVLLLMLAPFTPHICEELWQKLGMEGLISLQQLPSVDRKALEVSEVEVPVQVNGKLRSRVVVPVDANESEVRQIALSDGRVKKHINGKEIKRFIYIKNKLINIVTG
jgi:leucyl-tRNA synthetase